jgi:hypothetical protein
VPGRSRLALPAMEKRDQLDNEKERVRASRVEKKRLSDKKKNASTQENNMRDRIEKGEGEIVILLF